MAIRWYQKSGKRYYVVGTRGFRIAVENSDLRSQSGGARETTAYAVLDRDWMHREMGVWTPEPGGRSSEWCRRQAEALAVELNRREDAGVAA